LFISKQGHESEIKVKREWCGTSVERRNCFE